jgi:hypothetical protein
MGFVKILGDPEIAVESICSTLGRALALPMPRPLIVRIDPGVLPGFELPKATIAFATEDVAHPSLKRLIAQNRATLQTLARCRVAPNVGAFDEWTANNDRNVGNILFDGTEEFTFIDHGRAFFENITADQPASFNKLLQLIRLLCDDEGAITIYDGIVKDFVPLLRRLRLARIMTAAGAKYLLEAEAITAIQTFLSDRLPHLTRLISARLRLPQKELTA